VLEALLRRPSTVDVAKSLFIRNCSPSAAIFLSQKPRGGPGCRGLGCACVKWAAAVSVGTCSLPEPFSARSCVSSSPPQRAGGWRGQAGERPPGFFQHRGLNLCALDYSFTVGRSLTVFGCERHTWPCGLSVSREGVMV
jgi:hypothetical protein